MQFVILFVHRHLDFRLPELKSLLELQGLDPSKCFDQSLWSFYEEELNKNPHPDISPIIRVDLPSISCAAFLSQRGILVKAVYELWGEGNTYGALKKSLSEADLDESHFNEQSSWKVDVEAFGRCFSIEEQSERREELKSVLPFRGPVRMRNPDVACVIFEEVGVATKNQSRSPQEKVYFLHKIAGDFRNKGRGGARDLVDQQTLKRRSYIGPTSMDSELSLIMANMALLKENDLVLDPFVGTGSVLVACSTFGAKCFGIDIDIRVLSGKKSRNVFSNFAQYDLPLPELIRADNSLSPLVFSDYFDAIVCDPPYGIRAGARRCGCPSEKFKAIPSEFKTTHIPRTQVYEADDVMCDLVAFAARVLRVGGRLVYCLPSTYEMTTEEYPTHPRLRLVANSEQPLTSKYGRRFITMEKLEYPVESGGTTDHILKKHSYNVRAKIFSSNEN